MEAACARSSRPMSRAAGMARNPPTRSQRCHADGPVTAKVILSSRRVNGSFARTMRYRRSRKHTQRCRPQSQRRSPAACQAVMRHVVVEDIRWRISLHVAVREHESRYTRYKAEERQRQGGASAVRMRARGRNKVHRMVAAAAVRYAARGGRRPKR